MKIRYTFANGEIREAEVADELGAVLLDLDRREYNNNQTETRRHTSLNDMDYEGGYFIDPAADVAAESEKALDFEKLQIAMDLLLPHQKALLQKVYFEGRSIADVAREECVGESAIRDRLKRIIEKIKKVLN